MGAGMMVSTLGVGTAWSYLRTAQHSVTQSLRDAVPISFELERVAQLTRELIPEIQASQKVAAQLEVEVEYLEHERKQRCFPPGRPRTGATGGRFGPPVFFEKHGRSKTLACGIRAIDLGACAVNTT